MTDEQIINSLKASLFELTYIIDDFKQKEMMDMLSIRIKDALDASIVKFFMYKKTELDQTVSVYPTKYPITNNITFERFITYFNKNENITTVENDNLIVSPENDLTSFLLKLQCEENYYGFVLVGFKSGEVIDFGVLERSRLVIKQFLQILFNNRHHKFLHDQNQLLFQLSTKLHSVYRTEDVLEMVYRTMQLLYPAFRYYFLMSQEFDNNKLPIKLIEYSNETLSAGLLAFMNNKFQVEIDSEKNEMNIYSPLSGKQGVYGVLQVIIPQKVELIEKEINFITKFTNMVGRAVERTTLYQSSNQLVSDLQIINNASHDLNVNLERNDITATVKQHIFESCFAEQIGIILFTEDSHYEVLAGSTEYFNTVKGKEFVDFAKEKIQNEAKSCFTGNFRSNKIKIPFNSLMIIPMRASEKIFGCIMIAHRTPYYFSFDRYKLILSFVQHASLAYYNSILNEKLKHIAITDYLTNLYSRNHIDKVIKKAMEQDKQGALVLFDVDDFKQINDTFGHYTGDKVLKQIAQIIQTEMKLGEIAARWGGEEFAVYLPSYNLSNATEKANKIREKVINQSRPQVSLSCGVSIWNKKQKDSIEDLFIRTDEALYEAKLSGKNKVVQKTIHDTNDS